MALWSWVGSSGSTCLAVAETDEADLFAGEELLDEERGAGGADEGAGEEVL